MSRNLTLSLILFLIFSTGFFWPFSQEPPPITIEIQGPQGTWRPEVGREAQAQALVNLTGMEFKVAYDIIILVEREAAKHDLNPFLILGFIVAESNGKIRAYSNAGARGLMQIMPGTGRFIAHSLGEKWRGTKSLYEMETNIVYGVWYYKHLLNFFQGHEHAAMSAYNWGPDHIKFRLTKGRRLPKVYPKKVLTAQEELEREFNHENPKRFWKYFTGDVDPPSSRGYSIGSKDATSNANVPLDPREGP